MMGFIKKHLKRVIVSIMNYDEFYENMLVKDTTAMKRSSRKNSTLKQSDMLEGDSGSTMRFNVFSAIGGKIIEVRRYDERTDTSIQNLYIIHNDDDLAEQISHIMAMEYLNK
jgi:hypothetical protein